MTDFPSGCEFPSDCIFQKLKGFLVTSKESKPLIVSEPPNFRSIMLIKNMRESIIQFIGIDPKIITNGYKTCFNGFRFSKTVNGKKQTKSYCSLFMSKIYIWLDNLFENWPRIVIIGSGYNDQKSKEYKVNCLVFSIRKSEKESKNIKGFFDQQLVYSDIREDNIQYLVTKNGIWNNNDHVWKKNNKEERIRAAHYIFHRKQLFKTNDLSGISICIALGIEPIELKEIENPIISFPKESIFTRNLESSSVVSLDDSLNLIDDSQKWTFLKEISLTSGNFIGYRTIHRFYHETDKYRLSIGCKNSPNNKIYLFTEKLNRSLMENMELRFDPNHICLPQLNRYTDIYIIFEYSSEKTSKKIIKDTLINKYPLDLSIKKEGPKFPKGRVEVFEFDPDAEVQDFNPNVKEIIDVFISLNLLYRKGEYYPCNRNKESRKVLTLSYNKDIENDGNVTYIDLFIDEITDPNQRKKWEYVWDILHNAIVKYEEFVDKVSNEDSDEDEDSDGDE